MAEYPEPGSSLAFPIQNGPYFVPGADLSPQDASGVEGQFEEYDDGGSISYDDDENDSSDNPFLHNETGALQLDPWQAAISVNNRDNDADFDPESVPLDLARDDMLSDSSLDEPGSGSTRGKGRGRSGRGRGPGRPRGRGRGPGRPRGSRGGRSVPADHEDIDLNLFGAVRTRAPRSFARGEGRGVSRRGRRGPRIAPTNEEFNVLQAKAMNAFVDKRYEDCAEHCIDAIHINPEIFVAHSLLSQAYAEMGRTSDSIEVLFTGALTLRDVSSWKEVAEKVKIFMASEDQEAERDTRLMHIYTNITRIDRDDVQARNGRLEILQKQRNYNAAVKECKRCLVSRPNDLFLLRTLADSALKIGTTSSARPAWETAITHFMGQQDREDAKGFTFEDLNLYLDVLRDLKDWPSGLFETKRLARWLIGRRRDFIWGTKHSDDREWDEEDDRRLELPDFVPGTYQLEQYGLGLPADLRVKLGLFRLNMGPQHYQEAMVSRLVARLRQIPLTQSQRHFEPFDESHLPQDAKIEFADLLRDISKALHEHGHHGESLRFFRNLQGWIGIDFWTWHRAGLSAEALGDERDAVEYFEKYLGQKHRDTEIRIKVAAMHVRLSRTDRVQKHIDAIRVRETIWTIKSKQVRDADAQDLGRYLALQSDDPRNGVEGPDDDDLFESAASNQKLLADLPPRDLLNRMLTKLIKQTRPRPSASLDATRFRAAAPSPTRPITPAQALASTEDDLQKVSKQRRAAFQTRQVNARHSLAETEAIIEKLYERLSQAEHNIKADDQASQDAWTDLAIQLCTEFCEQLSFFTADKSTPFTGFTASDRLRSRTVVPKTKEFLQTWAAYVMQTPSTRPTYHREFIPFLENIPIAYGTINFPTWLDIFLQTALNLAHHRRSRDSYRLLDRLLNSNIFTIHDPSENLIQLTYLSCAIAFRDNAKQNEIIRFFVNERAPDPDVYRLFQIVNRSFPGFAHFYSTGPQQKFYARMVRAHDHLAMSAEQRANNEGVDQHFPRFNMHSLASRYPQKPHEPPRDRDADTTDIKTLDVQLLVMYGNMIAANNSHQVNALNYYMRAYAVQRDNPLACLSAACAYLSMSMKRLSVNRHHQALSAVAMLMRYKEIRLQTADGEDMKEGRLKRQRRMEGNFNEGRLWHFYGLMHLAEPAYLRVLEEAERAEEGVRARADDAKGMFINDDEMEDSVSDEAATGEDEGVLWDEPDFTMEAALALQSIYVHAGDVEGARELGEKWLVF